MNNMNEWFYENWYTYQLGKFLYTAKVVLKYLLIAALIGAVGTGIVSLGCLVVKNWRIILLNVCAIVSLVAGFVAIVTYKNNESVSLIATKIFFGAFVTGYFVTQFF